MVRHDVERARTKNLKNLQKTPDGGRDIVHDDKIMVEKYGPGTPEETSSWVRRAKDRRTR
ncbi:MAG: hypothetical protein KM296_02825 [Brockia lithotrophica]|nr:hypothetical protein [Brockia lithotrophica]